MLATFFVMLMIPKSVTDITNLSPTHLVSNIRHQHRCNRENTTEMSKNVLQTNLERSISTKWSTDFWSVASPPCTADCSVFSRAPANSSRSTQLLLPNPKQMHNKMTFAIICDWFLLIWGFCRFETDVELIKHFYIYLTDSVRYESL